jgi:uncharacterized membrane protein
MRTYRSAIAFILVFVTILGLASKAYRGRFDGWINNYGGGVLYEIFWILLVVQIVPAANPIWVSLAVFLVTCGLEVLQLWNPPLLAAIRSTLVGRLLLGTTFVWWDFPHYLLGCVLGWGIVGALQRRLLPARSRQL